MKLKKNHWLVYNYNYVFDKKHDHLNKNFCDLFWGGFVLFLVLLPFTIIPYLIGLIFYKGGPFRVNDHPFTTNVARVFGNLVIIGLIYAWYRCIQQNGWLHGGLYPFLIVIAAIVTLLGVILLDISLKEKYDNWRSRKESKSNILKEGFKSIKEKYCSIIEFED